MQDVKEKVYTYAMFTKLGKTYNVEKEFVLRQLNFYKLAERDILERKLLVGLLALPFVFKLTNMDIFLFSVADTHFVPLSNQLHFPNF